jgi:hypothetical protein
LVSPKDFKSNTQGLIFITNSLEVSSASAQEASLGKTFPR